MRTLSRWLVRAAASAILVIWTAPIAAQEGGHYTLDGDDVAVYDLAGSVEIVAGSAPAVEVEVRYRGPDAQELRAVADDIDGREALRIVFPDDEVVYPALGRGGRVRIDVDDDGTFGDDDRGWLERLLGFDRVTIRGSGRGLEAHADLRIAVPAGQRLAVYLGAGEVMATNVEGDLRITAVAGRIETADTRGPLRLDTGSGDIDVADATGDLDADAGSGDITARAVSASRVVLDTGSGDVVAGDIEAADVGIDTGSGSVEVNGVSGRTLHLDTGSGYATANDARVDRLTIETGSGSIDVGGTWAATIDLESGSGGVAISLLGDVSSLSIDTGSGSVTLAVPPDLGAEVAIDTGSGGIELDVPVTAEEVDDSHFVGRVGDGDGRIEIDTGSGSVAVVAR